LNIPEVCEPYLHDRRKLGLYYAGQICGVEGYVESIASGIVVALSIAASLSGRELPAIPACTMIGSLMRYVHAPNANFQPMNANFGVLPHGADAARGRRARHEHAARAALEAMEAYRRANAWAFP
jgi:methylenetetrahydrofolate--tRNA-(uracil-5-)-methyltransferase